MKSRCVGVFTAALVLATAFSAAGDDGARKLESAERTVVAEGAAWSMILSLSDGSLGLVIQKARPLDAIDACNVSMEWLRSDDGGKSWSAPVTISERRAPDGGLFVRRPDEGYIVYQQRNEAVGQLPGGRIVCAMCELDYFYDKDGNEEPRPGVAWNHENQGVVVTWSDDLGKTWTQTRRVDTSPIGGDRPMLSPHGRIVTLDDGTHLLAVYGQFNRAYAGPVEVPEGARAGSIVLRSTDNGETWGDSSIIMSKADDLTWEETALCRVDDRLLAHVRTGQHNVDQYVSEDGGRTWSGPAQMTEPGQQPGAALVLTSGNLLFTWGNRRPPFGAAAMLSRDGGQTWDYERRVMLGWDAVNESCGYANAAQTADGEIVATYYEMPATQVYRELWGQSRVYVVRFTEEMLTPLPEYTIECYTSDEPVDDEPGYAFAASYFPEDELQMPYTQCVLKIGETRVPLGKGKEASDGFFIGMGAISSIEWAEPGKLLCVSWTTAPIASGRWMMEALVVLQHQGDAWIEVFRDYHPAVARNGAGDQWWQTMSLVPSSLDGEFKLVLSSQHYHSTKEHRPLAKAVEGEYKAFESTLGVVTEWPCAIEEGRLVTRVGTEYLDLGEDGFHLNEVTQYLHENGKKTDKAEGKSQEDILQELHVLDPSISDSLTVTGRVITRKVPPYEPNSVHHWSWG